MKRISRRNFLKAMGISTTALALAACGGSSSSTAAGTAGSSAASAAATGGTQGRRNPSPVLRQPHCNSWLYPPCNR